MITIQMSKADYEYDVQGLCKSFYPSERIVFEPWNTEHVHNQEELFLLRVEMEDCWVCVTIQDDMQEQKVKEDAEFSNRKQYKNILKTLQMGGDGE